MLRVIGVLFAFTAGVLAVGSIMVAILIGPLLSLSIIDLVVLQWAVLALAAIISIPGVVSLAIDRARNFYGFNLGW